MASTISEIQDMADAVVALAEKHKAVNSGASQVLGNNSAKSIDWANLPDGAVDEDGNVLGRDFTPAEVSNVIGSLSTYKSGHWDNGHGGNYEQLCKPIV